MVRRNGAIPKKEKISQSPAFVSAQRNNLDAVILLVSVIRTALGPRGSYKMIAKKTDFVRPVVVTKSGSEALNRMEVAHPAAKVLVDAGKWIDITMGDGSVSVVLLTGALLEGAQGLMKMEIHPSTIVDGYNLAEQRALELLRELAQDFDPEDTASMTDLARSCIETVLPLEESAFMARLVVGAAERVRERTHSGLAIDPDQVSIVKKTGGTILDSELIEGIALYREPTRDAMPRDVQDARIALISETLKIRRPIFKAEISIESPEQMKAFKDEERRLLMEKVQVILRTGANVIISRETFDDYIQLALTKRGIMAIRRAQVPDIQKLARATGGRIVPEIETITPADLGFAKRIHVRTLERENWLFVEGCKAPKAVTILIRGSSSSAVETAGIAVRTALYSLERATRDPAVFPGGGSVEAETAHRLRAWALSLHDRRQLVVLKYAEALETIPRTLAESCGLNSLDAILEIRRAHANGETWSGVDGETGRIAGMQGRGVLDLLAVKSQIVKSATGVATTMIRVDNIFTQPKWNPPKKPPGPASHRVTANQRVPGFEYGEAKKFLPETW